MSACINKSSVSNKLKCFLLKEYDVSLWNRSRFLDFLLLLCFNNDAAAGFMLPQSLGLCVCVLCSCVCVRLYWLCSIDRIKQQGGPALTVVISTSWSWRKALFLRTWQTKAVKVKSAVLNCSSQSFIYGKNESLRLAVALQGQSMSNTSPICVIHKLTSAVWLIDFC